MDVFTLSRNWFNFSFENPELINPTHTAILFFAIEHCNRLGGKDKFGFPTQMSMEALGIKKHQTYIKYLNDLINWGFIKMIQKSTNQYSANIISLTYAIPKKGKALDKAFIKHGTKQTESTGQSKVPIDIQRYKDTSIQINNIEFDKFWNDYDKKVGDKNKLIKKWDNLTNEDRQSIIEYIPKYKKSQPNKKYRKNPDTFFNNKSWLDEIIESDNNESPKILAKAIHEQFEIK